MEKNDLAGCLNEIMTINHILISGEIWQKRCLIFLKHLQRLCHGFWLTFPKINKK